MLAYDEPWLMKGVVMAILVAILSPAILVALLMKRSLGSTVSALVVAADCEET